MPFPTLFELSTVLNDEQQCIEFLDSNGIFYDSLSCECGGQMIKNIMRGKFRCSSHQCRKEKSIRFGTFFYGSRLECRVILQLGYLWLQKMPTRSLIECTGTSPNTVCNMVKHFRFLVSGNLDEDDTLIGGPGITVEIDESKLGKRKYHRGHRVDGAWIIGGVEKTAERRVFLRRIERRDRETLLPLIIQHVAQGSIIRTDLWRAYSGLNEHGYTHETVNHSLHFADPNTGVNTNTIEGTWNGLKLQIKPRNRTNNGIDEHIMEFIWRRRHSLNLWEAFVTALKDTHYTIE